MSRKISPETIALLNAETASNSLAEYCKKNKQPRQLFVEVVKSCVGITEIRINRGKEVELFQETVCIGEGEAWCMAFMQTCIAYVEFWTGVISPLSAGGGCVNVWHESPEGQRVVNIPLAGAIAIWQHLKTPTHGHTGMVLDCDGHLFHAIEGNTADQGFDNLNGVVGQTGEGVHITRRRYDLINPYNGDMKLLGCLKPF
jgi:hypothetical protein